VGTTNLDSVLFRVRSKINRAIVSGMFFVRDIASHPFAKSAKEWGTHGCGDAGLRQGQRRRPGVSALHARSFGPRRKARALRM